MKYYAKKKYNKLVYFIFFLLMVLSIAIPVYRDKEILNILASNTFIFIIIGFKIYSVYKQSKVAILETNEKELIINDIRFAKNKISWDSMCGIRKDFWLSYKLLTLGGEIRIPINSLKKRDRENILNEMNNRILKT